MVDVARGLATLPTRPPTPPNEACLGKGVEEGNDIAQFTLQSLSTPDESPSSSADYFTKSSDRISKRVGFSPWTEYHKPPNTSSKGTTSEKQIRPLPPSKECRSSKSILKAYDREAQPDDANRLAIYDQKNFPRMLDDICRELASTSRSSRLDAYMTLNGCLKAYDEVPDPSAMAEKMTLLTHFIRRDLCAQVLDSGAIDTQLMSQAVKLLTIFLWTPTLSEMLTDEFRCFIVDRSLAMVEDISTPKTLVNHYMHLLATQSFRSKIMGSERVDRLLTILDKVTNNIRGNGVVGQRLMIYQRLLAQAKPSMITRVGDWMDHLFSGMLSTIKEIRSRAIAFGIEASLLLGTTSSVSRAVLEIFNRQSPEGKKFADLLVSRLHTMMSAKDDSIHVPQIWSVAILFLRSRRRQLEQWEHMKTWLGVIQKCFNSSDEKVKFQANIAWNRLIFAVNPDVSTGQSMVRMLRQPIMAQLDRKVSDKYSKHGKQIARASYCTLLYYAFRPTATHDQLDLYWEEYVTQMLPRNITNDKEEMDFACQVLISLLGDTQQKIWNDNRGNENGPIKPDELPRLDPRWVRKKAANVLNVFETILQSADWLPVDGWEARVLQAWQSFTRALGDAGSKEVKTSMECMTAVAHVLNSIKRFWTWSNTTQPLDNGSAHSAGLEKLIALVDVAVVSLGSIPFNEKRMIQTSQDFFEAAETPSTRSVRHHGVLSSPIVHLMGMLTSSVHDRPVGQVYRHAIRDFVHISLRSATSRRSKFRCLRDIVHLLTLGDPAPSPAKTLLWELAMDFLLESLDNSTSKDHVSDSPHHIGQDYREVVKTLEVGVTHGYIITSPSSEVLIGKIIDHVRQEVGTAGPALAVTEPLAAILCQVTTEQHIAVFLQYATAILKNVVWPQSRKETDHAQRLLWATYTAGSKSFPFNAFDRVYFMTNRLLIIAYRNFSTGYQDDIISFLQAVVLFMSSSPLPHSGILLKHIQNGLGCWIEDADAIMSGADPASRVLFATVRRLCATAMGTIQRLPTTDSSLLSTIEILMVSSLSTRHRLILNEVINLWNQTFGLAQELEYPEALRKVLLRLSSVTELQLPSLQVDDEDTEVESSPFNFIDTQGTEDGVMVQQNNGLGSQRIPGAKVSSRILLGPPLKESTPSPFLSSRTTPEPSIKERALTVTPIPRLRHDDSQIQFAAIESSPLSSEVFDSQLLTDRQKEVRERQLQDASVVFPDLRSSAGPKSHDTDGDLPKLIMKSDRSSRRDHGPQIRMSPTFPPVNALITDFLGSSPTPRSSRNSSNHQLDGNELPSSPPPAAKQTPNIPQVDGAPSSRAVNAEEVVEDKGNQRRSTITKRKEAKAPDQILPSLSPKNQYSITNTNADLVCSVPTRLNPDDSPGVHQNHSASRGNIPSEVDAFVDATPNRAESSPVEARTFEQVMVTSSQGSYRQAEDLRHTSVEISRPSLSEVVDDPPVSIAESLQEESEAPCRSGMDSSHEGRLSPFSDHEELLTTQIAFEMNRALSQATGNSQQSSTSEAQTVKHTKKRKRSSQSPVNAVKRTKPRSPRKGIQVVVERRASTPVEEEIYDCIVVAALPAVERMPHSDADVKQEQIFVQTEPRQAMASKTSVVGQTPVTEKSSNQEASNASKKRKNYNSARGASEAESSMVLSPSKKRRSARLGQMSSSAPASGTRNHRASIVHVSPSVYSPPTEDRTDETALARKESPCENSHHEEDPGLSQKSRVDQSHQTGRLVTIDCDKDEIGPTPRAGVTVAIGLEGKGGHSDAIEVTEPTAVVSRVPDDPAAPPGAPEAAVNRPLGSFVDVAAQTEERHGNRQHEAESGKGIHEALKQILRDARHVVLGPGEGSQIMSVLFDLGKEINEAQIRSHP